jgi:hypothetical protein
LRVRCILAVPLLVASCAPPERAPIQFDLSWRQTREQRDLVQCHYLKSPNERAAEIDRIAVTFPEGSHHVHIYRSETPADDGVEDCSAGIDWSRWSLLVGVQTRPLDWQLPDGVTIPIAAHQQLLIQVHWLNLTGQDLDRTIHVDLRPAARSDAHLGVAFGISKDVHLWPGESKSIGGWVPVPRRASLVALMGHFHGRGVGYRVDLRQRGAASGSLVYEAQDEQTFEFKNYAAEPPMPVVRDGEGLAYECDFENDTGAPITWGPNTSNQEHCNMAAYYYPAADPPSTIDFTGDLDRVEPLPATLVPGQSVASTVWLKQPAGPLPVAVEIEPSDPDVIDPITVRVPAWTKSAPFRLVAKRPGAVTLQATTGSAVLERSAVVEPLVLSEVYYHPLDGNLKAQWVELANVGDAPLDLSRFSLGAGGASYAVTRVGLGGPWLPPAGCLLLGNPTYLPVEDPTSLMFVRAVELSPALSLAEVTAGGVALFDVPVAELGSTALPFDAVVYGADNAQQLPAAGGGVAVPMAPAPPGASLERTATGWSVQQTPTPGICRVPHAW